MDEATNTVVTVCGSGKVKGCGRPFHRQVNTGKRCSECDGRKAVRRAIRQAARRTEARAFKRMAKGLRPKRPYLRTKPIN